METITTTTAAILALLLVLPVILLWALWRLSQNARRLRAAGDSYRVIGAALGISHTTARRWCLS